MRHTLIGSALTLFAGLSAAPVWADDLALVLANDRYEVLGRLQRGAEPAAAAEALGDMGFDLTVLPNGRSDTLQQTLE